MSAFGILVDFTSGERDPSDDPKPITVEVIVDNPDDENPEILGPFSIDDCEPLDVEGPIMSRILESIGWRLDEPGDFGWTRVGEHEFSTPHYEIEVPYSNRVAVWSAERRRYVAYCTPERTLRATIEEDGR